MRFCKPVSQLLILIYFLCIVDYTVYAEKHAEAAESLKTMEPQRRNTRFAGKMSEPAANHGAAANDLDPLPRNKRQLGVSPLHVQACRTLCPNPYSLDLACHTLCGNILRPIPRGRGILDCFSNPRLCCLWGCSDPPPVVDPPIVDPPIVDPPIVDPPIVDPPIIDPPIVDPPIIDPPIVDPPIIVPPIIIPPDLCRCTKEFIPVCGFDGMTYSNRCVATCKGAKIKYTGACGGSSFGRDCNSCAKIYSPVCGENGKEYANRCLLNCDGAKYAWDVFQPGGRIRDCVRTGLGGKLLWWF